MQTATDLEIKKDIVKSLDLLPTENLLEIRHFLAKLIGTQLSDSISAQWKKGEITPESIQKAKQNYRKTVNKQ